VRFVPTELPSVIVIEPTVHRDSRGFFLETYHAEKYHDAGISVRFVQDNHSKSVCGTIRGLHLQRNRPQAKLVRVIDGEVWDVAVDVRRGSPTFGRWVGVVLSAANFRQCFIPEGFAHGFCVLSPSAQIEYKCSDVYDPSSEIGIAWNDPDLAIEWPAEAPVLSERDRRNSRLAEQLEALPTFL